MDPRTAFRPRPVTDHQPPARFMLLTDPERTLLPPLSQSVPPRPQPLHRIRQPPGSKPAPRAPGQVVSASPPSLIACSVPSRRQDPLLSHPVGPTLSGKLTIPSPTASIESSHSFRLMQATASHQSEPRRPPEPFAVTVTSKPTPAGGQFNPAAPAPTNTNGGFGNRGIDRTSPILPARPHPSTTSPARPTTHAVTISAGSPRPTTQLPVFLHPHRCPPIRPVSPVSTGASRAASAPPPWQQTKWADPPRPATFPLRHPPHEATHPPKPNVQQTTPRRNRSTLGPTIWNAESARFPVWRISVVNRSRFLGSLTLSSITGLGKTGTNSSLTLRPPRGPNYVRPAGGAARLA